MLQKLPRRKGLIFKSSRYWYAVLDTKRIPMKAYINSCAHGALKILDLQIKSSN